MSKPKSKKSVKKIISDVVFGIVMAFLGLVILFSILQKTIGVSIGGYHVLWVKTNSMEPTIPTSSYILTKDVEAKDVKVGDIITFVSDNPQIKGMYNTHRVIKIEDGKFTTKGDNNPADDGIYSAKAENIVARYQRNMPFLSVFGRLFTTPVGYGLTVAGIVGLIAVWFTIDYRDNKKQNKKELMDKLVQEEVAKLEQESKQNENK